MKKFMIALSILALSALVSAGSIEAKGKSGAKSGAKGGKVGQAGNGKSNQPAKNDMGKKSGDKSKAPYGKSFKGKDGKSYEYSHCPSHLEQFCKHHDYRHWNHYCWFDSYGCCGYYCPTERVWFYWYEPFYCYLPVQQLQTYRPVEVAPATQVVNVNTNTNVNGTASTGSPALPDGATPIRAGFTPPIPGKE